MHSGPVPADPGRDEDPARRAPGPAEDEAVPWEPVVTRPDPMSEEDQQALLDAVTDDGEPWWLQEGDPDPDDPLLPPEDYDLREIAAEGRRVAEDQARAAASAARLGTTGALAAIAVARRGPGQPGSAQVFPGGVSQPGRAVRLRDAVGHHGGLPGAGRVRG